MEGQRIGSYRVGRKIGQGGMGAVYEAVHEQLGRKAAIKLLRKELSQDPQIAMRFLNEARAASRVEHSGIVEIFEFGHLPDNTAYIIMEFLRGEALSARLRALGGKLPLPDTIRVSRQIASALSAAHAKGIVHRDLKPDNVMLVPDSEMPGGERIKILDFGVAKVVTDYNGPGADDYKTNTGVVLGTASYMVPEQCKGAGSVTAKADVYSLGVVMYRMLVGHLPFRAEGQGEVMAMHIFARPRPLREIDPNVPEPIAALVERMMEKEPNERPSMVLVAGELERLTGKLLPGGQPVLVMTGSGPVSSGQHPTAPTLSVVSGMGGEASGSRAEKGESVSPGTGQRLGRWFLLLLLLLLGGGVAAWRLGALQSIVPSRDTQKPPPAMPPAPPPVRVSWSLSSVPDNAQVIRKSDGTVLGVTPWFHEQPSQPGKLAVILRAPGHQELEIVFDESSSASRHETLSPLASPDLAATDTAETADMAPAAPPTPAQAETSPTAAPPPSALQRKPKKPKPIPNPSSGKDTLTTDEDVEIIK